MSVLDDLADYIATPDFIRDNGSPTVSMALIDSNGRFSAQVITSGEEDTATVYQACSISKAITALALAKLVDLNKLSYDDKVIDIIPTQRLEDLGKMEADMESVTLGALVSHRSGLSQHGFPGYAAEIPTVEDIFNGRPFSNTPRIRFSSFPFAQFSYSGGGFLLLQLCLEHALDMPFAQIMHDTVLAPLQMTRSWYTDLPDGERNYAKAYLTGEQVVVHPPRGYHMLVESAAAGLWTTPTDLLKAVSAIQRSLRHDNGFLSTEIARKMLTKVTPNHEEYSMAMGWSSNGSCFAHRGDNAPGYNTYVFGTHEGIVNTTDDSARFKGALAIMANSVLGFPIIQKIMAAIFYLNRWPRDRSLPRGFGFMTDFVPYAAPPHAHLDDSWKAWVGKWKGGWMIIDDNGVPKLESTSLVRPVLLRPAAVPAAFNEQVLVAKGYEIALRLREYSGRRHLHIIQSEGVQHVERESNEPPAQAM
ncbi:hypothetical protein AMS68_003957 [Peltaster fructicola]|uniref:Beta-lactamase-related domain-containing protein n=1 Tax=Peltaster fructicola TaxID=286661 RepID=A0A6H0XVG6_9PEZI|nr:hypothetical protein AMS68_003957 [Peltaster fructicola]